MFVSQLVKKKYNNCLKGNTLYYNFVKPLMNISRNHVEIKSNYTSIMLSWYKTLNRKKQNYLGNFKKLYLMKKHYYYFFFFWFLLLIVTIITK